MGSKIINKIKKSKFYGPFAGRDMHFHITIFGGIGGVIVFLLVLFIASTERGDNTSVIFDIKETVWKRIPIPDWWKGDGDRADYLTGQIVEDMLVPGWGDSDGGRPGYSAGQVENNYLGDQILFNSISGERGSGDRGGAYSGDEKDFVRVCQSDADPDDDSSWKSELIAVEDVKSYMVKLHINNNNSNGYDAVAKDTKAALRIPSYSDTKIPVRGYIESSNATPFKYWDSVTFYSAADRPFHLEFKPGTAMLRNGSIGADGLRLSDDIVFKAMEGGTLIGYKGLDGEIPGGSQYSSEVTAWIDVIYDSYGVHQEVRKLGDKAWAGFIEAEVGDQVEFQIEYKNASDKTQTNVMIRDILPGNLEYVPKTTKIYNSNYREGAALTPDGDIVTRGVNIGSYVGSPDGTDGGNAYIRFTAKVVDNDLGYGKDFIYNWVRASVGDSVIENPLIIIVQKSE